MTTLLALAAGVLAVAAVVRSLRVAGRGSDCTRSVETALRLAARDDLGYVAALEDPNALKTRIK